jgi:hypothetical protein
MLATTVRPIMSTIERLCAPHITCWQIYVFTESSLLRCEYLLARRRT